MPDRPRKQGAVAGFPVTIAQANLTIGEYLERWLWSIQPSRTEDLATIFRQLFGEDPQPGAMRERGSLRWLQPWPRKALLLSDEPTLPEVASSFESRMTDISHGLCEIGVAGPDALDFVNAHCSADLDSPTVDEARNLRCLLGQYALTIWWDNPVDLRLLVDRSRAQSLCDFLQVLAERWQAAAR